MVGAKACFLSRPVPIGSLMVEVYNDIMKAVRPFPVPQ